MESTSVAKLLEDAREIYGAFGKTDKALEQVNRALVIEPDNVEALNLRAAILYEMDRDDEATASNQRALEINPCSVEALHGLAAVANDQESYPEALQWLDRAFACIPQDPDPEFQENEDYRQRLVAQLYVERAFALWYSGDREQAQRLLTEDGPRECPLEVETFEDELDWLEHHPEEPE
ncbi:MAG: tetratricopeptide repeat protein [Armatimonadota bacterium]